MLYSLCLSPQQANNKGKGRGGSNPGGATWFRANSLVLIAKTVIIAKTVCTGQLGKSHVCVPGGLSFPRHRSAIQRGLLAGGEKGEERGEGERVEAASSTLQRTR